MEKWIEGARWGSITEIEVVSSTDKSVVDSRGRRHKKDTSYAWIRPTRAEVVELIRASLLRNIEKAEANLTYVQDELAKFDAKEKLIL